MSGEVAYYVGGSMEGKTKILRDGNPIITIPIMPPLKPFLAYKGYYESMDATTPALETETYRREKIIKRGFHYNILVIEGMNNDEALERIEKLQLID